jgi:hypothetical protein
MSSISSIPAYTPINPPASQPKAPDPKVDGDSDDAGAAQPVAAAPLPPGQGTRIDQIV